MSEELRIVAAVTEKAKERLKGLNSADFARELFLQANPLAMPFLSLRARTIEVAKNINPFHFTEMDKNVLVHVGNPDLAVFYITDSAGKLIAVVAADDSELETILTELVNKLSKNPGVTNNNFCITDAQHNLLEEMSTLEEAVKYVQDF